ncbi:hypothetical protein KKF34_17155 [Myxococcota bacterium]|nr:hypothetical protein [Myxococcota bacterium]MBU1383190.1 hypothetical protein [Myxococcota bacterium]MBU1498609.1 hypothetical protein [Myxococcota bacterium]
MSRHNIRPFTETEIAFFSSFNSPWDIQQFLDSIPYNAEHICKSPAKVLEHKSAHCFEGALFAACALTFLGHRPLVVDLGAENDDDHVIAVFRRNGLWGAIAKSNFTTLRYREPVYKTIRELGMSYFDFYFNANGDKSLRRVSTPLNLKRFDSEGWMTTDEDCDHLAHGFIALKYTALCPKDMIPELIRVPQYMLDAGMLGVNPAGLYIPQ